MILGGKRGLEPARAPEPAVGFHAQLHGASLWDLVQMECLARSHLVVEVTGEGGVGYLFFDAGRVVHATTARQKGETAALEILCWTHGTFQASNRAWPAEAPTIEVAHESLLLRAAKARDEGVSNLVAFPSRGLEVAVREAVEAIGGTVDAAVGETVDAAVDEAFEEVELLEIEDEGEVSMRSPNIEDTPIPPVRAESSADFPVMVRLSSSGAVLRNKGGTEELAEAAAYAHRLVQLTGELLGLEEFVAIECTFTQGRCLIFTEGDGDVVVLRPRADLNLQALRERLGL
jgi:Domain of unknown function (DUF4388)